MVVLVLFQLEANIASECLTGHDFSDDSGTTSESSNDNQSSKKKKQKIKIKLKIVL